MNRDGGSYRDLASVELLNEHKHLQCDIPSYPIALNGVASSATPSGVVSCGGCCPYQNICYRLTKSGSWVSFPSMKSERAWLGMKMINGRLWAIGGTGGGKNSMESIDPENEDKWTTEFMPFKVSDTCVAELSDLRLMVIGGWQEYGIVRK